MINEEVKIKLTKTSDIVIKMAAIAAAITAIAGGYAFALNYVWQPTVVVKSVDFDKGVATLEVGEIFKKVIEISGDTTYQIAGDWGVRFATVLVGDKPVYNRLELVRKQMVFKYLSK